MADSDKGTWNVTPHGPLVRLADNLHWVVGDLPGMSLKRNMVVVRRADGSLVLHNGIAMDATRMAELEALGRPSYLVVPNGAHRLDAPAYKRRYPDIRVVAPKGSRARVEQRVGVDLTYDEFPHDAEVRFETLDGLGGGEGAMIVRSPDGITVVLNDAVFNMDKKTDALGWLITSVFGSAPGPRISRLAKMLFVKDQPAFRKHLLRLAEIDGLTRLIVAHEKCAHGADAAAVLREAAGYLRAS